MEHAADGLFDDAAVTTWNRGSTAEVIWASGANHRGMRKFKKKVCIKEGYHTDLLSIQEDMLTAFAKFLLEASQK